MIYVLVADPDSTTRSALALLLQRKLKDISIAEAEDVETLIRALTKAPPDLLLLDWSLYGSPAPETSRLLQRAYPNLKIVLFSVDADHATAAEAAGATFVHKGAAPDDLLKTLEPLIEKPAEPARGDNTTNQ